MIAMRDHVGVGRCHGGSISEELLLALGDESVAGRQRPRAFLARETAADADAKFLEWFQPRGLKWKGENPSGETLLVVRIHAVRHAAIADTIENTRRVIHHSVQVCAMELHADIATGRDV